MRLSGRLISLFAVASLLPLGLLGTGVAVYAYDLALEKVSDDQARFVDGLALSVDTWLSRSFTLLELQAEALPLDSPERRAVARQLIFRQTPGVQIVALLDPRGAALGPALYRTDGDGGVVERDLDQFQDAVAAELPLTQLTVGASYATADDRTFLPVAVPTPDGSAVLCVAVALDELQRWLQAQSGEDLEVGILDESGALLLRSGQALLVEDAVLGLRGISTQSASYPLPGGGQALAASATVPQHGWTVVVAEPMSVVSQARMGILARTLFMALWAAILSAVLGVVMTRQLTRPIFALTDAVRALARGELSRRVEPLGREDELSELGAAFNNMGAALADNAREIAAKNAEIEAFNAELQGRVEERTRQLAEAQAQLIASARLAAVGEMGAGLAHELNNPMAGILGLTQVLRAKRPDDAMLRSIEEQARRCREILHQLQQLSAEQDQAEERWVVVDLREMLQNVLSLVGASLRQRGVEVSLSALPEMRVRADQAALGRALASALISLRALFTSDGGRLVITAPASAAEIGVDILAEGGQDLGGDDWRAAGLGLWSARQVLDRHGGSLRQVDDSGARWALRLPAAEG